MQGASGEPSALPDSSGGWGQLSRCLLSSLLLLLVWVARRPPHTFSLTKCPLLLVLKELHHHL